jgi:exodeoxyribonuclease-5
MVGQQMGRDLLSFGIQVLVLGDNAQLPTINDGTGFFTARVPDFQLTEIQRQAFDSPIIQLATTVRNRERLRLGQYGDSAVMRSGSLPVRDLIGFDQIICGTHRTRRFLNNTVRNALGFSGNTPQVGEKLLCLKNNKSKGLYNGTMWTVIATDLPEDGFVEMEVCSDEGISVDVHAPVDGFWLPSGGGAELARHPFTFGYAITCHKAQGSQWGSVAIRNEALTFREHSARWLYIAITRAVDRVVIT